MSHLRALKANKKRKFSIYISNKEANLNTNNVYCYRVLDSHSSICFLFAVLWAWQPWTKVWTCKPTDGTCIGVESSNVWMSCNTKGTDMGFFSVSPNRSVVLSLLEFIVFAGTRSCWCWSASLYSVRTQWSCDALCAWSEWKSCDPKMYRVCSYWTHTVHNFSMLWTGRDAFNTSLWL